MIVAMVGLQENSMRRTLGHLARPNQDGGCSTASKKMTDIAAPQPPGWHAENAVFVAACNELIDAEGVTLEE